MKDRNKVIAALQKFGWSLETSLKWISAENIEFRASPQEMIDSGQVDKVLYFLASKRK